MKLIHVDQRDAWELFIASQPNAQVFQSWVWGEFRETQGSRVKRFALVDDSQRWIAALQCEFRRRHFNTGYWFIQRGPVFADALSTQEFLVALEFITQALCEHPEMQHNALFLRMEPFVESKDISTKPARVIPVPAMDPSSTMMIDLTHSIDVLLKSMHEKTRYNLRLAERKGVTTRCSTEAKDVDAFIHLMDETAKRDRFVQHSHKYLQTTFAFLQKHAMAHIRIAEWNGEILCANMEVLYGDTVTYLYGASSSNNREVMAAFALQWSAMQDAKNQGYHFYDFWGCNPEEKTGLDYKQSWEGITRFKQGWGGIRKSFVGTWDVPFKPLLYRLAFLFRYFKK